MRPEELVLAGIKGHVVCLRKADGSELWRKRLKRSGDVTISRDGTQVYAAAKGYLFALDLYSGDIRWQNNLPGLGFGACVMGTPNQGAVAALIIIAQQQAVAMAAMGAGAGAAAAASS